MNLTTHRLVSIALTILTRQSIVNEQDNVPLIHFNFAFHDTLRKDIYKRLNHSIQ